MENNNNNFTQEATEPNLREQIEIYLRQWPWFIIAVLVTLTVAYLYLRYTTPIYQSRTSIIIKDSKGLGAASEYAAFEDIGLISGMNANSIENEIALLRSKRLLNAVVDELNLEITYFREGNVKTTEMYQNRPFTVTILEKYENTTFPLYPYHISIKSDSEFELIDPELNLTQVYKFGERIQLPFAEIVVIPNLENKEISYFEDLEEVKVRFREKPYVVASYQNAIQVNPIDRNASVIEITLNDPVSQKAEDILNELVEQYNKDAIEDRSMVTKNTAKFIDERLQIIFQELDSVESGKVEFKEENRLTNIEQQAGLMLQTASEFQKEMIEVKVQLELVDMIYDILENEEEISLLPANLGITEDGLSGLIASYNNLVLERNRFLRSATEENPIVITLTSQINNLKQNVLSSLENVRTSLEVSLSDLEQQESRLGSKMLEVPGIEKTFRGIERQQGVKEALYLFLLQKREETAISLAVTAPKAKVVDPAYSSFGPVSPKRNIVLLAALLLGLLIPFLIIYLGQLLYNKIRNRKDVEHETKAIGIVGEVPKMGNKEAELIGENDRSILAESFRILRTNLHYLFVGKTSTNQGKTIFVTSTVKGEGKTFVAMNLALTLASSKKKVLIIGADIRNPQFHRFVKGAKRKKGFTDYLVSDELTLPQIIEPSGLNTNLDILYSGSIPPNPAELLLSPKVESMFEELRNNYDYIIVDTAPSMLVTDTFLINKNADVTLYVIRADYTEKKLLEFPVDAVKKEKLNNVAFVLNNIKMTHFGYYGSKYYGYGYAYGADKNTFFDKLKAFFGC